MSPGDDSPPSADPRPRGTLARLALRLSALLRGLLYLAGLAWAFGAIFFDGPITRDNGNTYLAIGYLVVVTFFLLGLRKPLHRFLGWLVAMALVFVPWSFIKPSEDADWQSQWARTATARIEGDLVTITDFRNFDYRRDGTVTERWEERRVHLSKLQALDYFHHAFGGQLLAHPVLSFDFGDDGHVAFSVETRRRAGEAFKPVAGLYKRYGLVYLVGDERDFIRDRAIVRKEPVRLYRASYTAEHIRHMFLETITAMNALHAEPRFYNTITANCTTSYRTQAPAAERARFDYRMLVNGRMESLLYERGAIATDGLPLDQLLERASINEAADAAFDDPAFSSRIRVGRPGF